MKHAITVKLAEGIETFHGEIVDWGMAKPYAMWITLQPRKDDPFRIIFNKRHIISIEVREEEETNG